MPIKTNPDRDTLLTDFGKATLSDRYLLPGESFQDRFAAVARAYQDDDAHGQRIYDYMSQHWFMPSTPVLSNGGADRGLPISCFLNELVDSIDGIADTFKENVHLASSGGGIGSYFGNLRALGEKVGKNHATSGVIPFMKMLDSQTMAISQSGIRRGSAASYLPIWHPECEEFIEIRKPTGGDPNRRCLNLHHGVVIDDAFMEAVRIGSEYNLVSPKTGEVIKKVDARSIWIKILTMRVETGEAYLLFIDTVNRFRPDIYKHLGHEVKTSNLCVAGDTRIMTRDGYKEIQSLAGQNATLWNGVEWSESRVEKTSDNARLRKIEFSNGSVIWATDEHKFYLSSGGDPIKAIELKIGDKIEKSYYPIVDTGILRLSYPYTNGFFSADGAMRHQGPLISLYGEKKKLALEVSSGIGKVGEEKKDGNINVCFPGDVLKEKFFVPHGYDIKSKVEWLAGYFDGDGYLSSRPGHSPNIEFSSCEKDFVFSIQRLLHTLGADCKISKEIPGGEKRFPSRDGNGQICKYRPLWRALLDANSVQRLVSLGMRTKRLPIDVVKPRADNRRYVTVVSNGTEFKQEATYCANEPKRHRIMLEGILTGNCSEIMLHTSPQKSAVCCLSSLNLETYDEWKDIPHFIEDVYRFLDNVLQDFIDRAPDTLHKAKYAAMRERSVGLGVMGWHSFLQARGIAFGSAAAKAWNRKIFRQIREEADMASITLADEKGACPDGIDAGVHERFTHKMAVAPTASISIIAGNASPGIEPIAANVFLQKTLSGSFTVRNRHLERVLEAYGRNDAKTWSSITTNRGSVQHLDFLTPTEREVFKTAIEIDQNWVIEHAADRTEFVDQGQSVNLFLPADIHKKDLHAIHFSAWEKGLKSLYYCRSLSLQRAENVSEAVGVARDNVKPSFEVCEACQ